MRRTKEIASVLGSLGFLLFFSTILFAGDGQLLPRLEKEIISLVNKAQKVSVTIIAQTEVVSGSENIPSSPETKNSPRKIINKTIGSGFIFSKDGYIITKKSVIDGAERIDVLLYNGKFLKADLVAEDPRIDLAILRVNKTGLPAPEFAPPEDLHVGSWVIVMGRSIGFATAISFGMVQGVSSDGFLKVGIQVSPGIIGAPIFNFKGQVVGILFAKLMIDEGDAENAFWGNHFQEGLALPISQVKNRIERLIADSKKRRGWLGITVSHKNGKVESDTLLVTHVFPNSPAAAAGLKAGDYILKCNGIRVRNLTELLDEINPQKPQSRVSFKLLRHGTVMQRTVSLGERPSLMSIRNAFKHNKMVSPQTIHNTRFGLTPSGQNKEMLMRIRRLEKEVRLLRKQIKKR